MILRQNIVEYLRCNPTNNVGQAFKLFVCTPWEIYLREMQQNRICGEKIVLQTISNVNTIQNCVLSTLGLCADIDIQLYINSSDNLQSYPQIFLCHCAEGQGVHYVPPSEELEDHIDKSSEPLTNHQIGRNLPDELWQIIFKMTFQSFVYEWPHHICSELNTLYNTRDRFATLIEVYFQSLPQIYIGISNVLLKEKKSKIAFSVLKLVTKLGSLVQLLNENIF